MDLFRPTYRTLTPEESGIIAEIKAKANELNALYDVALHLGDAYPERARGIATARTNLQQSVFWAVHGVTAEK